MEKDPVLEVCKFVKFRVWILYIDSPLSRTVCYAKSG